jgi:hypothetical protein
MGIATVHLLDKEPEERRTAMPALVTWKPQDFAQPRAASIACRRWGA